MKYNNSFFKKIKVAVKKTIFQSTFIEEIYLKFTVVAKKKDFNIFPLFDDPEC